MITLTVINNKGGVGKSFLSTQFAFYCALKRGLRTLFIDLDPQAHSSNCLFDSKLFEPQCFFRFADAARRIENNRSRPASS